ncbi:tripartite tricarboxylate transporter substrate binding protein [Polaromonas sp. SM01]|uniref:Bug family tripartite tricarboxylate transporter substrate binding protein n=1 Tax=Polaromonas sp. SM01 TaxID=3085630 RepID=UPI002981CD6C|nr:tripartite tricarboxylate transporter substrate binding protein [Polaromonas sp. SM01]MDW5441445.1 tripartite tricarboxylate transporter substrate binding protein [Polaromonas sp. SM01]
MNFQRRTGLLLACAALAIPTAAFAQAPWPSKPVKLVVPYAAGGPADVVAREIAQRLAVELKQPVLIENQGGAMGMPALTAVARAEPDGHTLLMPALGNVVLQPLLSKNGGADLLAKLRPVSMVSTSAHVLVVSAKLPVKTVRELVDYAKANPGKVSFASAGTGGTAHLGMEMFKVLSKTDVLHVPYKGSSAAVGDLVSGQVSAMFSSLPSLQGVADKGYVRVIGATAASTSAATRSLPLLSATLPGFDYTTWYALYAPLATPTPVVERLNAALRKVLQDPALQAKIEPHGVELLGSTPEEVQAWTKRDTDKWGRVIRDAHISLD